MLKLLNRQLLALLLLIAVSGCQTPPPPEMPLTDGTVTAPLEIASAQPLELESGGASFQPVPPPEPTRTNTWISLQQWGALRGLNNPVRLAAKPNPTFTIGAQDAVMALTVGSRLARWNGLDCWLGFAPQLIQGLPHIHLLDARKNLEPLLPPHPTDWSSSRTIMLDPGHGGRDPGTRSTVANRSEKDYTLDWAIRLRRLLGAQGWKVLMTRTNDIEVPLGDRVVMADRANADLFLSLHFNSAYPKQELAGIETYCLTPVGMPSNLLRYDEDDWSQSWPNNAFDEENLRIAEQLHRVLVESTGAIDRGIRRARFMSVLRGQRRPAVLIEGGYLSNPTEGRLIHSGNYRQQLAEAVAKALQ